MENIIEKDLALMARDLFDIAHDRNKNIAMVSATYKRNTDYDYVSVRAIDENGNVVANLNKCIESDKED